PFAQTPPSTPAPSKPVAAAPAPSPQTPETPVFKTGVDVVTVEVGVADKTGHPVRDLTAADFIVKIDGKPRRIVSARHISFDADKVKKRVAASNEETYFTTNIGPPGGRLILLAVDQTNIRAGAVRPLLNTAAKFLDHLSPLDQ